LQEFKTDTIGVLGLIGYREYRVESSGQFGYNGKEESVERI
jgi:hypothetical protein